MIRLVYPLINIAVPPQILILIKIQILLLGTYYYNLWYLIIVNINFWRKLIAYFSRFKLKAIIYLTVAHDFIIDSERTDDKLLVFFLQRCVFLFCPKTLFR